MHPNGYKPGPMIRVRPWCYTKRKSYLNSLVARPTLSSSKVNNIEQEAVNAFGLSNRCYGVTEQGAGQWALLCEYASYGSLDAWLGRLPDGHISRVAYSVAMALAATHEASLIHCDVKPSNVLLGRSGPKLADFALAGHGGSRGTFQYMAPERLLEPPSSSAAADVWGLGMTLLVARLGSYPATHASIDDFWWALEVYESEDRLDRLTAGARIPGKLKDMLDRCLCFSTAGRPSARDVANHAFAQQRVRLSEWCRPFSVSCPFEQLDAFLDAFREHSKKHEALCSVLALRQTETACLGPTISGEMHSRLGS